MPTKNERTKKIWSWCELYFKNSSSGLFKKWVVPFGKHCWFCSGFKGSDLLCNACPSPFRHFLVQKSIIWLLLTICLANSLFTFSSLAWCTLNVYPCFHLFWKIKLAVCYSNQRINLKRDQIALYLFRKALHYLTFSSFAWPFFTACMAEISFLKEKVNSNRIPYLASLFFQK